MSSITEKVVIKNKTLSDILRAKLDKIENDFNRDELAKISDLVLNFEISEEEFIDISYLVGLTELVIINFYIGILESKVLCDLEKIKYITFTNCEFNDSTTLNLLRAKGVCIEIT